MWDIRVGMKVICVNDDVNAFITPSIRHLFQKHLDGLRKDEIYTIRSYYKNPKNHPLPGEPAIRLMEIIRDVDEDNLEPGYTPERFRPLNKNFSVFEEILKQPLKTKTKIRKVEQA